MLCRPRNQHLRPTGWRTLPEIGQPGLCLPLRRPILHLHDRLQIRSAARSRCHRRGPLSLQHPHARRANPGRGQSHRPGSLVLGGSWIIRAYECTHPLLSRRGLYLLTTHGLGPRRLGTNGHGQPAVRERDRCRAGCCSGTEACEG